MPIQSLLCEHPDDQIAHKAYRAVCRTCGSYWDLESCASEVAYDERYPEERGHFDARVSALKLKTLQYWLRAARVTIEEKRVCEVGFGGGACLPLLVDRARHVIGLEANASAIARVAPGVPHAELRLVQELPNKLGEPVDLWLFQDSFEHIPSPAPFVDWMRANSAAGTEILMVLPRGDSMSRRLMGRMWPHKLPDHQFHWSRKGLVQLMERRGFALRREFFPLKFVSPHMLLAHARHHAGAARESRRWLGGSGLTVPLNFGEMGLLFRVG